MAETNDWTGLSLIAVRAANALGKPFGLNPFPRAFASCAPAEPSRGAVFDRIYRQNAWGSGESRSGLGSENSFAAAFRRRLSHCLETMGARTLLDAPCGDLNWILPLAQDKRFQYLGADISEALISDLQAGHPQLNLRVFDIVEDPFPQADAWLCRDCFFHLPTADVLRALSNFARSTIPYALITTHRARLHRNLDAPAGGFRYLDLERPPFSLPRPLAYLRDYRLGRDFPRYVAVWRREAIAAAIGG
jgi:hypothetical protein